MGVGDIYLLMLKYVCGQENLGTHMCTLKFKKKKKSIYSIIVENQ